MLSYGVDGVISHSKEEQTYLSQWLEQMPATRISEICNPDGSARFAYSIDLHRGEVLGLHQTPGVITLTSKPALHTYISRPENTVSSRKSPLPCCEPTWRSTALLRTAWGWALTCAYPEPAASGTLYAKFGFQLNRVLFAFFLSEMRKNCEKILNRKLLYDLYYSRKALTVFCQ